VSILYELIVNTSFFLSFFFFFLVLKGKKKKKKNYFLSNWFTRIYTLQVKLDYPDEFLTSIHGHYGSLNEWGPVFVRSLTFESNMRTYGPFGVEQGTCFSFPMTGGKIVGFHGKCGWYLDAIGAYLKPIEKENPSKALSHHSQKYAANGSEKVGYSVIQGTIGESFDIVLAVRQKDDLGNPQQRKVSREISIPETSDLGTKEKVSHLYHISFFSL
jgi:hypothetical protein